LLFLAAGVVAVVAVVAVTAVAVVAGLVVFLLVQWALCLAKRFQ